LFDKRAFNIVKTIKLQTLQTRSRNYPTDDTSYTFIFSVVDSSLVGKPREKSASNYCAVSVTVHWEVLVNWGFIDLRPLELPPARIPDLQKVLFWYAKEHIEKQVRDGTLSKQTEVVLSRATADDLCPFDISRIPDPRDFTFNVDLPQMLSQPEELFIDDIDSFARARDIKPQDVGPLVPLDLSENQVQTYLEEIIGENFHQQDWGGELNDLVTSHVRVGERRVRTAFLLKGNGTKGKLTIAKCGKKGDQILRLVEAPADLYVIQHVSEIDERVVYDLRSKVQWKNSMGEKCQMCVVDGTDTARILKAYGKI
jgi:hypothetical protein